MNRYRTTNSISLLRAALKCACIYVDVFAQAPKKKRYRRILKINAKVEEFNTYVNINCTFKINILFGFEDTWYTGDFLPKGGTHPETPSEIPPHQL